MNPGLGEKADRQWEAHGTKVLAGKYWIEHRWSGTGDTSEIEANARLIAAAKELLAALRRHTAVSSCDGHGCTGTGAGVDDCPHCQGRAAIAKAQGPIS